jgi:hypothetical protein
MSLAPTLDRAVHLLNCGQLAAALGVSKGFVTAMRHCGFPMPGNRATIANAHAWLQAHPTFASSKRTVQPPAAGAATAQ